MQEKLISYNPDTSVIHKLLRPTKLISFMILTSTVMYTYDIRIIAFILIFSFTLLKLANIKFSQIRLMLLYVIVFLLINEFITFIFSPEEGVKLYSTRHVLFQFSQRRVLTLEQLF
ncbi:MAG: hypothetical protein ACP5PP_03835 [Fervidobacterium sp.]